MDYLQHDAYVRAVRTERRIAASGRRRARRDAWHRHPMRRAVACGLHRFADRVAPAPPSGQRPTAGVR